MGVLAFPVRSEKFSAQNVVMTRGVSNWATEHGFDVSSLVRRHYCGDWGDVCAADAESNNQALVSGDGNLHSAFDISGLNERVWVITEWDRSVTTVLFPHEY